MRIHILFASAAALVACGGSTAPLSSGAPDASSDVATNHVGHIGAVHEAPSAPESPRAPGRGAAIEHTGSKRFYVGPTTGSSSSGGGTIVDAGTSSSSFSCGTGSTAVMCTGAGQYCKMTSSNFGNSTMAECTQATGCPSSGANCGCVDPFDGGTGCTCADNGGHVTLTCPY